MNKNVKLVATCALTLSTFPAAAMDFKVSGQLNRAVMNVDDGQNNETYFVDNTNSSSRVRVTGSGNLSDDIEAGVRFEWEFESNPSSKVNIDNPNIPGEFQERWADVYFRGAFGEAHLGQGDGAANGMTHVDLSGTNVASLLGHSFLVGGGTLFQEDGVPGPSVTSTAANFDFESRYDRMAYYSPKMGPITLVASVGRKDDMIYEASARYGAEYGFGKVAAGVGYSHAKVDAPADVNEIVGGSVSVLLNNGLNGAISYSNKTDDNDYDSKNTTFRLGYKFGRNAFSLDYSMTEDRAQKGDDVDVIGANYVYKPVDWAELYASVRQFALDRPGANYDDIQTVMLGSRLKF